MKILSEKKRLKTYCSSKEKSIISFNHRVEAKKSALLEDQYSTESKPIKSRKGIHEELYLHNTKAFESYKNKTQPQYLSNKSEPKNKATKIKERNKVVLNEYKSLMDAFKESRPRPNNPIIGALNSNVKELPSSVKTSLVYRELEDDFKIK